VSADYADGAGSMRSSFLRRFAIACSAPLLWAPLGCSVGANGASADGLERDAADGASSTALIVLERTVTADDSVHGNAVARFIRMRAGAVDDETMEMVGATLDLPDVGACRAESARAASSAAPSTAPRAVELLDVGAIAFEANGTVTTLDSRALPDIVDLVTGVLYSTRTTPLDSDRLPSRGGYVVRTGGSAHATDLDHAVAPFVVLATAPGEPDELRIDGQDARAADGVTLTPGARVDLAWAVSDGDDPDDVVYVDVLSAATRTSAGALAGVEPVESVVRVRCLFADRGTASLPASAFVVAGGGEVSRSELSHGMLVVHRVHRELFQFAAQGTPSSGVIRFDFARAAEFTRR